MKITPEQIEPLIVGSKFYGTGGGGSAILAREVLMNVKQRGKLPVIAQSSELQDNSICITGFPVGGLNGKIIPDALFTTMIRKYQDIIQTPIAGIIPVEIGPLSLAVAVMLAGAMNIPLVDADIVGGRSTPEVYLETITMFDIQRTPLLVWNTDGDYKICTKKISFEEEENFLRSFAATSGGFAYVFGYPLSKEDLMRTVAQRTVSAAITAGTLLRSGKYDALTKQCRGVELFCGTLSSIRPLSTPGFTSNIITIKDGSNVARVFSKNENLIVWINNTVCLTCPDLIILADEKYLPIENTSLKNGMQMRILGVPCNPLWNTKAGRSLFSPKQFGYDIQQKLLIEQS